MLASSSFELSSLHVWSLFCFVAVSAVVVVVVVVLTLSMDVSIFMLVHVCVWHKALDKQ